MSRPTPAGSPLAIDAGDDVRAACNIGPWEIRRRRRSVILAFAAAAILLGALVTTGAPAWSRLVVLLPAWGAAVSWLQVRRRFCVAYAMAGLANFGDGEGTRRSVAPALRARDRRATVVLVRDALLIAIVPTLVAVFLPV